MPKRRPKGAGLRGWWRSLPFLMAGFGLMFLFTWLETQRLNNEYRAQDLTQEISEVKARMQKLREQIHHLNSFAEMERMERKAPSLDLIEPNPGQIVPIRVKRRGQILSRVSSRGEELTGRAPTRSAVISLAPSNGDPNVTILQEEVERLVGIQGLPR